MNMHSGRKLLEVRDLKNIVCLFVKEVVCCFQDAVNISGTEPLKWGFWAKINDFT